MNADVAVRRVEAGDLARLSALYRQLTGEFSDAAALARVFAEIDSDENAVLLGAYADGVLVGTAYLAYCRDLWKTCRPFGVVENVVVDEDFRGGGVGRLLMEDQERRARARGCTYLILVSSEKRAAAHRFYGRLGYGVPVRGFKKYLD